MDRRLHTERCLSRIGDGVDGRERSVPNIHLQSGGRHRIEAAMLHALLQSDSSCTWPMLPSMRRCVNIFLPFSRWYTIAAGIIVAAASAANYPHSQIFLTIPLDASRHAIKAGMFSWFNEGER